MGYYTDYKLTVNDDNTRIREFLEQEADFDTDYLIEAIDEYRESRKWYEHDEDMKKLSIEFPDKLFKLEGEGEESGDVWIAYYKNGMKQYCPGVITFDEFDESKLQPIK